MPEFGSPYAVADARIALHDRFGLLRRGSLENADAERANIGGQGIIARLPHFHKSSQKIGGVKKVTSSTTSSPSLRRPCSRPMGMATNCPT